MEAASWYKAVTLLESAGHCVTTLDLGASGSTLRSLVAKSLPFRATCNRSWSLWRLYHLGRGFGGFGISLARESFPQKIVVAVYVTAFMPSYTILPAALIHEITLLSSFKFALITKINNVFGCLLFLMIHSLATNLRVFLILLGAAWAHVEDSDSKGFFSIMDRKTRQLHCCLVEITCQLTYINTAHL
ncbi:hypothetical protein RJ639_024316, partial [Escallonia herrerae]